jgi:hypothetical protein
MPPKSQRQARLMRAVAEGTAKLPGLSKKQAAEYVKDQPKGLPEKAPKRKGR